MAAMEPAGPQTKIERRYASMFRAFVHAVASGYSRRARALGAEMDVVAAQIGKARERELLAWLAKIPRKRSG